MVLTQGRMPRISDLWKLQEIDSALDVRRATLDDARARIGDSEELLAARAAQEEREQALAAAKATQRDLEVQADDLRAKIGPAEQKLYSGSVRNPKELQDLQADVDQLKRHLSSIEDQDIAALTAVEEAERELATQQSVVATLESAWQTEQAELRETAARLEQEIAGLDGERATQAEAVDAELLKTYGHVRYRHQGKGVAKVDRNICLGCRIALPPTILNRARSANGFAQCPNCERILFT
jgi:predicted  nucleic acid-binding Zn-ribbon protein